MPRPPLVCCAADKLLHAMRRGLLWCLPLHSMSSCTARAAWAALFAAEQQVATLYYACAHGCRCQATTDLGEADAGAAC